ncbi:MAG TPA: protealysin inhibitor emfourin [Planctomycetota bacterium]|nr:protealysin inhibitor emfourin [Planctomycetota bacterium]
MTIDFSRGGGLLGRRTRVRLDLETLPAPERKAIEALVDQSAFFSLAEEDVSRTPDVFDYVVEIEHEGKRHRIHTDDVRAPKTLQPLLEKLRGYL